MENVAFVDAAAKRDIARKLATSAGPGGRNRDYLLGLPEALRALGKDDEHVFAIERHRADFDRE